MIDRKQPPTFSTDFNLTLLSPEKDTTANGAQIFWIRDVKQQVVKVEIIFKGGKWFEPKNGVSFFTAALLDKGTTKRTSREIADYLDQLGSQIECSSGLDYLSISIYSLNRTLNKTLSLVSEIVSEANFPQEELDLTKSIQLQNLKINNQKNSYVASKLIRKNIFGSEHPYGRYLEESSIDAITTKDLSDFYQCLTPFQVYITGNINPQDYKAIIWCVQQISRQNSTRVPYPLITQHNAEEKITKNESIQSSIRLGKISIKNASPDYPVALVFNHILGGYFGSRLMKNIREEKGLTYGIYSSMNTFSNYGFLHIGAEVNKENTELTIREIKNELNKLLDVAVTREELTTVKNHLLGSLQLEMANPFSVTEKIKNINLNDLPESHYQNLLTNILSLSQEDIIEVGNMHFNTGELNTVVVG